MLPPITISRTEDGSTIPHMGRKGNNGGNYNDGYYGQREYNLNNAGDSLFFGLAFCKNIVMVLWWLLKAAFSLVVWFIRYLLIAIPFPFTTYYWFVKTHKNKNTVIILLPAILYVVILSSAMIPVSIKAGIQKQERIEAAREEYEEIMSYDYDLSFGTSMELRDGEYRLIVTQDSAPISINPMGRIITKADIDTVLVCTGETEENSSGKIVAYKVFITEDRTKEGWILALAVTVQ